jgi:hypothetical protein
MIKHHAELFDRLDQLIERFPDIRLGQLICNLTVMAGKTDPGAVWDIEDEELLAAAQELLRQQAERESAPTVS